MKLILDDLENGKIQLEKEKCGCDEDDLGLFTFNGSSAGLYEFRATSVYCIPIYPEGSEYFEEFGDFIADMWFPGLSGRMNFITGKQGLKLGVISHAANLKPQPIPTPSNDIDIGFKNGMLVSLLFGAVPKDIPIWLESTRDIIEGYKTADFWELSGYDARNWLNELAGYIGWTDWPYKKYMDL